MNDQLSKLITEGRPVTIQLSRIHNGKATIHAFIFQQNAENEMVTDVYEGIGPSAQLAIENALLQIPS